MRDTSSPTPNNFSIEIESLRGIAAFIVVFGHVFLFCKLPALFPANSSEIFKVLIQSLIDPQPPVLLFFTISGLVLGRQLRKNPVDSFRSFIAYLCRRGFRLMPLIWVTTFFAFVLDRIWNNSSYSLLFSTLLLQDTSIHLTLWSMQVELWCSLFFPLIFWIFKRRSIILNALLFMVLLILSLIGAKPLFIQFLIFFHAGLLVDLISANLCETKFKNPLILLIAYLIFILAPEFPIGPRIWNPGYWQGWIFPELIACSLILFFIVHSKKASFNAFLRLAWIRYFGKISFGIYLFHLPILIYMASKKPITSLSQFPVFFICYFAVTLILSSLAYHWIEIPFNELGKKIYRFIMTYSYSKPVRA